MEEETCAKKSHILEYKKYKFGIWKNMKQKKKLAPKDVIFQEYEIWVFIQVDSYSKS